MIPSKRRVLQPKDTCSMLLNSKGNSSQNVCTQHGINHKLFVMNVMYVMCNCAVNVIGLLPESLWKDLLDRFESIYKNGVREIQRNLDLANFGWDCWETLTDDEDDDRKRTDNELDADSEQFAARRNRLMDSNRPEFAATVDSGRRIENHIDPKLRDSVAAEWQSLTSDTVSRNQTQCVERAIGGALDRIRFVLTIFREYFLEQMMYRNDENDCLGLSSKKAIFVNLFAECLSEYDAVSLLNDFELIKEHRTDTEELRDSTITDPSSLCCRELMKECRDTSMMINGANNERFKMLNGYLKALDARQQVWIEITSRVHAFINHSIDRQIESHGDEEKKDESNAWQATGGRRLNQDTSSNRRMNKFVNEMGYGNTHQHQDTTKVPMLQNDSLMEQNTPSHLNELKSFRFGYCQFYHPKHWERSTFHIEAPKYRNLKQECLQNTIYPMSRRVFVLTLELARSLRQTKKGRSFKVPDLGQVNQQCEMPCNSPISISHIFAISTYCDFTDLQKLYKKFGCREITQMHSLYDAEFGALKNRHKEIAWWYRLLYEGVHFFGTRVSETDVFYTGLDCHMVFDDMVPDWFCPFSTTVSSLVALNFATENGTILKMVPTAGSFDRYFDCEWLSEYPDERERLFVFAHDLQIIDIRILDFETRHWITHSLYVRCLSLFSYLFIGYFLSEMLHTMDDGIELDTMLLSMIRQYESIDEVNDTERNLYAEQLCNAIMQHFKMVENHYVIKSQFQLLSKNLQRKLLLFDDEDNITISPFLKSLGCSLGNMFLMKEYIWKLTEQDIQKLNTMTPGAVMSSAKVYLFPGMNGCTVKVRMNLNRATHGSGSVGIGFKIEDLSAPALSVDGFWTVSIEEVNWYKNGSPFTRLAKGISTGIYAFDDYLCDTVASLTIRFAMVFKAQDIAPRYHLK